MAILHCDLSQEASFYFLMNLMQSFLLFKKYMPCCNEFISNSAVVSLIVLLITFVPYISQIAMSPISLSELISILLLLTVILFLVFRLSVPVAMALA